jgi:hypothetical protein
VDDPSMQLELDGTLTLESKFMKRGLGISEWCQLRPFVNPGMVYPSCAQSRDSDLILNNHFYPKNKR